MFNRHYFTTRRLALGLSVEELAGEIMVAPSTVYRWESGETSPNLRTLIRVSRSLRVPLHALAEQAGGDESTTRAIQPAEIHRIAKENNDER
ncbi:helix-turn-helix transcriptional regulator [Streptomyces sp. NPDC048191]|uniref:helix-turn-helix domain-containing protein n=1 Tax=Streptomyces sp. NPDC048191 TaxID=3155484 RepID=UPI0033FE2C63